MERRQGGKNTHNLYTDSSIFRNQSLHLIAV